MPLFQGRRRPVPQIPTDAGAMIFSCIVAPRHYGGHPYPASILLVRLRHSGASAFESVREATCRGTGALHRGFTYRNHES